MSMGGSKPAGNTTTTTKSEPWEEQKPFILQQLGEAKNLYGGGTASRFDTDAYNQAMAAWKAGGGSTGPIPHGLSQADYLARGGRPDDWHLYSRNYHRYSRESPPPSGAPMPTMEQFRLPADPNAPFESKLAPGYFPGKTIADQSPYSIAAQDIIASRALGGSPIMGQANNLLFNTLKGDYLSPTNNPGFKLALDDAADAYRKGTSAQTNAAFNRAGAFGGSAHREIASDNNRRFADSLTKLAGDMYGDERTKQMQSLLFAPQAANQDYADAQQLAGVGGAQEARAQDLINAEIDRYNYEANLPANALRNYIALTGGNYGGTSTATNPYFTNRGAGALGGALAGGQIGSAVAPSIAGAFGSQLPWLAGPWGAGIGAGLGLLGGLL